jgi:hypothetical protein
VTALSATHRSVLEEIGISGSEPERLRRHGREFNDLDREGLVMFWPIGGARPHGIYGGGVAPGRWYVSAAGAAAIGLDQQRLRLTKPGSG